MRGQHQLLALTQCRIGRQRLGFEHIQPSGRQVSLVEQFDQCGFVDQAAARRVDDHRPATHRTHACFAEHVACFIGERHVQRDDVAPGEQVFERAQRDVQPLCGGRGQMRIVGSDLHPQAARFARDGRTDSAESNHGEALTFHFEAGQIPLRPFTGFHSGVGKRSVTRHRK